MDLIPSSSSLSQPNTAGTHLNNTSLVKTKKVRKKCLQRPCDACAIRKVKCDSNGNDKTPCSNCIKHKISCTNKRIRKKLGPKNLHKKTLIQINNSINNNLNTTINNNNNNTTFNNNNNNNLSYSNDKIKKISIKYILPCLKIYQSYIYGVWPILSVNSYLISKINNDNDILNHTTSPHYSMVCAVSAAIVVQSSFLNSMNINLNLNNLSALDFANEAIRVRSFYDFISPSIESLLTSYFLYKFFYYSNVSNNLSKAIYYLRESITFSQLLGLHLPTTYKNKPPIEQNNFKKIYYLLYNTERYISLEHTFPIVLDPIIDLPILEYDDHPHLLNGFLKLLGVFKTPDKSFFETWIKIDLNSNTLKNSLNHVNINFNIKNIRPCIIQIQNHLSHLSPCYSATDIQKIDIVVTKFWIKSLTWTMASKFPNLLINPLEVSLENPLNLESSLRLDFPFFNLRTFINIISDSHLSSFAAHGPIVILKLLQISESCFLSSNILSSY
ncbi:Zn(II)2Cys6 transcription factor ASCRUDRAFT_46136, partial [Ascoidea rubescens DSM 1968]